MRVPRKLFGLDLDEIIAGGAEPERIAGRGGADSITGGAGCDALRGNRGDDTLVGGEGDDTLAGGGGSDLLMGGAGVDLFRFAPTGGGQDTIEGYVATEDQLEFLGYDDVVVRVLSATEALVTFGPTGGDESVLLRGAVGEFPFAFALGDLAVSNNLRIETTFPVSLILPVGEILRAPGDLSIVTEGPPPRPPFPGGDLTLSGSRLIDAEGNLLPRLGADSLRPGGDIRLVSGGGALIAAPGTIVLPDRGVILGGDLTVRDTTWLPPIDAVLRVTNGAAPREGGLLSVAAASADAVSPVFVAGPALTDSWSMPPDNAPLL